WRRQPFGAPDAEPVGEQDRFPLAAELRLRDEARLWQAQLERDAGVTGGMRAGFARPRVRRLHRYLPLTGGPEYIGISFQSSEYARTGLIGLPSANRAGRNWCRSTCVAEPCMISSASASPTAGEILKPIPEKPAASTRPGRPCTSPSNGRASGVMSYAPAMPASIPASASAGTRLAADPTSSASSAACAVAGTASGSTPRGP